MRKLRLSHPNGTRTELSIDSSGYLVRSNHPASVAFTVGTEATTTINVTMIVKDANGNAITYPVALQMYLSDNANGLDIINTAHSSGMAIGTNGVLIETIADKVGILLTTAAGLADITFTEAADKTAYLVVILPDGRLQISGAITHT